MAREQRRLWRSKTGATRRWLAIVIAFAAICVIGLIVVGVVWWLAQVIGVPSVPTWTIWLGLATALLPFAIAARTPALVDGDQGWTEYVIRAVVIGEDSPRPMWWRIATVYAFGPALAGYAVVYATQAMLGLV